MDRSYDGTWTYRVDRISSGGSCNRALAAPEPPPCRSRTEVFLEWAEHTPRKSYAVRGRQALLHWHVREAEKAGLWLSNRSICSARNAYKSYYP
jgi:hypothetical protein